MKKNFFFQQKKYQSENTVKKRKAQGKYLRRMQRSNIEYVEIELKTKNHHSFVMLETYPSRRLCFFNVSEPKCDKFGLAFSNVLDPRRIDVFFICSPSLKIKQRFESFYRTRN